MENTDSNIMGFHPVQKLESINLPFVQMDFTSFQILLHGDLYNPGGISILW